MKTQLLERLTCPQCLSDLRLETISPEDHAIDEGVLHCSCGALYPIIGGIPRLYPGALAENLDFLERNRWVIEARFPDLLRGLRPSRLDAGQRQVRDRFERQWRNWGEEERIFGKSFDEMIRFVTGERVGSQIRADFYPGKRVLDAGCGHGRYLSAFSSLGAEVYGIDLGHGIDVAAKFNRGRGEVHLVQGDLLHLPFKPESFDLVFCDGVSHHTPSTKAAFDQLAAAVKPGGYLYLWVYPRGTPAWEASQRLLRSVTTRMPPWLLHYLCFMPVPLLSVVPTYSGTNLQNSSWKECAQVVWDWYSPRYQWHHTEQEVTGWFKQAGFEDLEILPVPTGVIGRKRGSRETSRA